MVRFLSIALLFFCSFGSGGFVGAEDLQLPVSEILRSWKLAFVRDGNFIA